MNVEATRSGNGSYTYLVSFGENPAASSDSEIRNSTTNDKPTTTSTACACIVVLADYHPFSIILMNKTYINRRMNAYNLFVHLYWDIKIFKCVQNICSEITIKCS